MKKLIAILVLSFILFSSIISIQASGSDINLSGIPKQSDYINTTKDQNSTFVVDFLASPVSGIAPLKVQFEDKSNVNTSVYEWDFNSDGKVDSKEKNPVYSYVNPGKYSVSLRINNGITWKNTTKNNYVLVGEKPEASFTAFPRSGENPLNVRFSDTSTGNITSWFWDFGDGKSSTLQNPSHIYTESGVYGVNLKVSNAFGFDVQDKPFFINVSSPPKRILDFISDVNSGEAPLTVQFKTLSTGGKPVAWEWDFNSDGQIDSKEQNPIYEFKSPGTYTVTLKESDGNAWETITKPNYINVENIGNSLKASFTASPTKGTAPLTVQFNDASTGVITSWFWDFGDGSTSTSKNPLHIYSNVGTYTVKLKVANGFNSNVMESSSLIIVSSPDAPPVIYPPVVDPPAVNPPSTEPPTAEPPVTDPPSVNPPVDSPAGNPPIIESPIVNPPVDDSPIENSLTVDFISNTTSGSAPLVVQFEDNSENVLTAWEWDFDSDGEVDSTEKNPICKFNEPGNYTVTLKGRNDTEWGTVIKTNYINVTNAFQADFIASPIIGDSPLVVQFTDASTGNPTSWFWDFGDGNTSTLQNPNHTYFETGIYSVTLNVSNMHEYSVLTWKNYIIVDGNYSNGGGGGSHEESDYMGSAGVGGGGSPEPVSNIETKEISQKFIASGNRIRFEFPQKGTSIDFIEFDAKKTLGKTTTIIEQLKGKSVLTPIEPGGTVYKYLNIWVGNEGFANSENIEDAIVGFRVNKAEIVLNETEESMIKLQRYTQGVWNALPTDKTWEDDQYIYFQAKTPGFSPFAITSGSTELSEYNTITQENIMENSGPEIGGNQIKKPEKSGGGRLISKDTDWSKVSGAISIIIVFMVILFVSLAIREKRK